MKLIYLQWQDATSHSSWFSKGELEEWLKKENDMIEQVGWVFDETEKHIVLIGRRDFGTEPLLGLIQKIPKTWIKKRIDLSKYIKSTKRLKITTKSEFYF